MSNNPYSQPSGYPNPYDQSGGYSQGQENSSGGYTPYNDYSNQTPSYSTQPSQYQQSYDQYQQPYDQGSQYNVANPQQYNYSEMPYTSASSGMAVTSVILGVLGLLTSMVFVGSLFGLVAIILGIIAVRKVNNGTASGKGLAIAGIITGLLSFVATIITTILIVSSLNNIAEECRKNAYEHKDGKAICRLEDGRTLEVDEK